MDVINVKHNSKHFYTFDLKLSNQELKIFNSGRYSLGIEPHFQDKEKKTSNEREIVTIILNYFRIEIEDILEMNRVKIFVDARMFISFYLRKYTDLSFYKIGKLISRDHASVIYMIKRYKAEMMYDDTQIIKEEIDNILVELNII